MIVLPQPSCHNQLKLLNSFSVSLLDKTLLLTPGYAGRHIACREINDATPRRALILGSATWLAKQMNLIEFIAAADELFHKPPDRAVGGWQPDHLQAKNHYRTTRFLGFVEDLEPIFRKRKNWYCRRQNRRRVQAQNIRLYLQPSAYLLSR
jgi:hypothetical protein